MTGATELQQATFKRGSTTYFNSSIFFPPEVRRDVTVLYAFVRVADDYVDAIPQRVRDFETFCHRYRRARAGQASGDPIIDDFVELSRRKGFDPEWTEAFLYSMELDLRAREYNSLEDTLVYIYGSAEVIGLFMARLLDLPEASLSAAKMLGRAMQYINFIRDIAEDTVLGRRYLPLAGSDLSSLNVDEAKKNPEAFSAFIRREIDRFAGWQREAERGFAYIPRRYLIPIKTASGMYKWTARCIYEDPLLVFQGKVKPSRSRIVFTALLNAVSPREGRLS